MRKTSIIKITIQRPDDYKEKGPTSNDVITLIKDKLKLETIEFSSGGPNIFIELSGKKKDLIEKITKILDEGKINFTKIS